MADYETWIFLMAIVIIMVLTLQIWAAIRELK